jgi:hypothetical protein
VAANRESGRKSGNVHREMPRPSPPPHSRALVG